LESAWFQPLNLKCDILVSKLAFKCHLYRYSVAIETRGFTYVTSGRKRETLKGDATFAFYDHIGRVVVTPLPGVTRLLTWNIPAVINLVFSPYSLVWLSFPGVTPGCHSRVSLPGVTPGCHLIGYTDHTGCLR
jgi:hypothetical protein